MGTISTFLILAGLGGVGYMAWRLLRRQRGEGDPAGHPSIVGRVLPTTLLAFFLGATLAPPEEATNEGERVAQERDGTGSAVQQGSEGDAREGEETVQRERQAERRRRAGETGRVTRVIDGDTVEIAGVGRPTPPQPRRGSAPSRLVSVTTHKREDADKDAERHHECAVERDLIRERKRAKPHRQAINGAHDLRRDAVAGVRVCDRIRVERHVHERRPTGSRAGAEARGARALARKATINCEWPWARRTPSFRATAAQVIKCPRNRGNSKR